MSAARWLASTEIPPFTVPASWPAWEQQRVRTRATLLRLLGDFPRRPAVAGVRVLSRTESDDYSLEKFTFDNGLGADVPGYLFLPKRAVGRVPAVLYCHWHGAQYDIGKEELRRTNATPVPPGPTLARLGYAVLGIDACCFGERNGQGPGGAREKGPGGEMTAAKFHLWTGRTLWGAILRDDLAALDYLCSRPEIDPSRIGVTGISMGSTRSWWLMALDDRIKAGVGVAGMTRYEDLIRAGSLDEHGIYYFVPGLLRHFDMEAVIACAAPRPLLFQTGGEDGGSPLAGVAQIAATVSRIYGLAQQSEAFSSVVYPGVGHTYLPAMWTRTERWLNAHLHPQPAYSPSGP